MTETLYKVCAQKNDASDLNISMGLFYENRTPPFTKHSIFPLYDNMYKHARERRKITQIQVIHT